MTSRWSVALRLIAGAALAWFVLSALPSLPLRATAAAVTVIALTLWTPVAGLTATVALAPAGLLIAPSPARAAELVVWAFVGAWLVSIWRPLAHVRPDRRTLLPAVLFAACAAASWLAYVVGGAAGIEPLFLPAAIVRAVPADHLVFSSPEPETFTLLPLLAGIAFFALSATVTRQRREARYAIAAAIVLSAVALSVLTFADVVRQWAAESYGGWFLLRFVHGERFSLHVPDLNAAGSHYVLALLIALALALLEPQSRRVLWIPAAAVILPALWISGSRSASLGGLVVGGSLIPFVRGRLSIPRTPARRALVLFSVVGVVVLAAFLAAQPSQQGSAATALRIRAQFLITSARMFVSAPMFGVGIGHYHERSDEFMPASLRRVYGHENAHNYFAQQFAEMGIVGGAVFIWLVAAVVVSSWRTMRSDPAADAATIGLLAGSGGYLLTCVTGHPLLVPEAALPFWGAFGALAGVASPASGSDRTRQTRALQRLAVSAVLVVASMNVALQLRRYATARTPPGEQGFYALEMDEDSRQFVWMTRHGVFYAGPQPGTIAIPVRAPNFLTGTERFFVAVEVGGRRVGVYEAMPDRWTTIEIPIRGRASTPFRRIDLRANRSWSPMRDRGIRGDDLPRSVMVGETQWTPAGGR